METNLKWHAASIARTLEALETDLTNGLPADEHHRRLEKFGPNVFGKKERFRFLRLLWAQLASPLVFILIFAGIVTILLEEFTDTIVIFASVAINTMVGMYQEGRASKAFEKLRSSVKKYAVVQRSGRQLEVEASTLVPGDIVIIEQGKQVPADLRICEQKGLEINEAILTGEWLPVAKNSGAVPEDKRITEQTGMAWMGTLVEDGWAKGVVAATGNGTELGKIAHLLQLEKEGETPFGRGVSKLARIIGYVIVIIVVGIFVLGVVEESAISFGGGSWQINFDKLNDMFLIAVAIAVSAIPEGLPVAVTVILAIGMSRILSRGGLVKRLVKAETLGSTTVILTDKTGTLTKGEMELGGVFSAVTANRNGNKFSMEMPAENKIILKTGMFTAGAFIENPEAEPSGWVIRGRPTDKALLKASARMGMNPKEFFDQEPRLDYLPFDSERRFAASLHGGSAGQNRIYITGAPEFLMGYTDLSDSDRKKYAEAYEQATTVGMRVVATAYKDVMISELPRKDIKSIVASVTFTGLIGFHDPVRPDVKDAIASAKSAGLRPIIITGDHANTASSVAREVGFGENPRVIVGEKIEGLDEEDLREILKSYDVFARVLPHQKLALVRALRAENEVVAMTGDGVNDAPALKQADIGIAVGSGTDVAKEASDLVLLKDSFSVIVAAIEEGRGILDNLRKVVTYLLSIGSSEVVLVSGALVLGYPLPILPVQILWNNIVQEGFMNFAFAFEPKEKDIMKRGPREHSSQKVLTSEMIAIIFGAGLTTSILLLAVYMYLYGIGYPAADIRTVLFAGLSLDAIFFTFSLKNLRRPLWRINILSNKFLLVAFGINCSLLAAALTVPFLQKLLGTVTPNFTDILIMAGLGIINLFVIEAVKFYFIRKKLA